MRIHAAGICYHDVLSRAGRIPGGRPGGILGHEIAGEIAAVGANVARERVGERVVIYQRLFCGVCRHCLERPSGPLPQQPRAGRAAAAAGTPNSPACRRATRFAFPMELDMTAAALAVCPVGTSVRATLGVARPRAGTNRADHRRGRRARTAPDPGREERASAACIAVTSSQDKVEIVRAAGADEVIISPELKFSARGVAADRPSRAPTWCWRTSSPGPFAKACGRARNTQRWWCSAISARRPVEFDPGLVIMRRIRIAGSGNATFKDVHVALHLLATGAVKPFIGRVLPFPQAAEGHALMERRAVTGRVVLAGW